MQRKAPQTLRGVSVGAVLAECCINCAVGGGLKGKVRAAHRAAVGDWAGALVRDALPEVDCSRVGICALGVV